MKYITTIEIAEKWDISERRVRKLLEDGRIEGAYKLGKIWNIPEDAVKPIDKRIVNKENSNFIINVSEEDIVSVDKLKKELDKKRPLSKETIKSLNENLNLEWIYNSNGIEGNTLTLRETKVVLEGVTVGGKSIREHLEAINHEEAIKYLEELLKEKDSISEWNIKNIHSLVLKDIDNENAGRYRKNNVIISGSKFRPPEYTKLVELMEGLISNYNSWSDYHPIIRAALLHGELVKIHPFIDGNGRTSRLVMNFELMKKGYLPVVIKKDKRLAYYEALDKAHLTNDYTDFVKIIIAEEKKVLDKYLKYLN